MSVSQGLAGEAEGWSGSLPKDKLGEGDSGLQFPNSHFEQDKFFKAVTVPREIKVS